MAKILSRDFSAAALKRDAHRFRLCVAAAILKQFRDEHGRDAASMKELEDWAPAYRKKHGDGPMNVDTVLAVLTRKEIEEAVREYDKNHKR